MHGSARDIHSEQCSRQAIKGEAIESDNYILGFHMTSRRAYLCP